MVKSGYVVTSKTQRSDYVWGIVETIGFDTLNRLTGTTVAGKAIANHCGASHEVYLAIAKDAQKELGYGKYYAVSLCAICNYSGCIN